MSAADRTVSQRKDQPEFNGLSAEHLVTLSLRALLLEGGRDRRTRLLLWCGTVMVLGSAVAQAAAVGITTPRGVGLCAVAAIFSPTVILTLRSSERGSATVAWVCISGDLALATAQFLCYPDAYTGLVGTALFVPLGLLAALAGNSAIGRLHVAIAIGTALGLGGVAVAQDADVFAVTARVLVMLVVISVPTGFSLLHDRVQAELISRRHDRRTGFYTRTGLEAKAAVAPGAFMVILSIVPGCLNNFPRTDNGALERIAALLREALPGGTMIARLSDFEHAAVAWTGDREGASRMTSGWHCAMSALSERTASDATWQWGCAVVDHQTPSDNASVAWTLQRGLAAAELRRQHPFDTDCDMVSHDDIVALAHAGGPDIVFQPIVRHYGAHPVGYEALARFPRAAPPLWFSSAAQQGVGGLLEHAAIRNAAAAARDLPPHAFLSLNLSPAALLVQPAILTTLLEAHNIRPVIVELTEHDRIEEIDMMKPLLAELRQAGIRIAIDDVGSGYAGLGTLVALQPEIIKIDANLVRDADTDPHRAPTVAALIAIAVALDAECVCEGVETMAEAEFCQTAGAHYLQGYLLGQPTDIHDMPNPS